MNTKRRIAQTAISLFNQHGTGVVSTNHIAEAAGISPGNLYYHFKNKSQIIQSILDDMFEEWNEVWRLPQNREVTEADLWSKLHANFALLWKYRFFYREAVGLFQHDQALKEKHIRMTQERHADQTAFAKRFVAAGVLRPFEEHNLQEIITVCWIIATNWLTYLEMNGEEVTEQHFSQGIGLIRAILSPYLNGAG